MYTIPESQFELQMGTEIGIIRRYVLSPGEVQSCVVSHSANPPSTMGVERFISNDDDLDVNQSVIFRRTCLWPSDN